VKVQITKLTLDPKNARKHSQRNLDAIAASLVRFGQRKPLVVHRGVVLAGNGTLEAARSLGWTEIEVAEVPDDWDMDTAKAYALADNKTAELAEWDESELAKQLLELDDKGWDIHELGFEMPQVIEAEPIDENDVPEVPAEPTTKVGDVWQLGKHRLVCGDSTDVTVMEKLLGDEKVDLVWTDPPYGVSYVGKTKDALTIENDSLNHAELTDFLREAFNSIFTATRPGACWYVAAPSGDLFQCFSIPLTELGVWKHTLVWVKDTFVMGRADYHYRHESIFYGWTPGAAHQTPPDRKQDTIWEIKRPKANKEHPTMKPVELIERAIQNSSLANQIVLDAFGGSGSTLIACEQTKRLARLIELDPKYCDVIVKRWENLTGQKAELVTSK
jgi:site-specific DNA-methyltransferase (adenine-specific)